MRSPGLRYLAAVVNLSLHSYSPRKTFALVTTPTSPAFLCWPSQDSPGTGQSTAETIGRELECQLLFGENVDSAGAVSRTTLTPAASKVQAGVLVVSLEADASKDGHSKDGQAAAPSESSEISSKTARALEGAEWALRVTGAPLLIVCSHFVRWQRLELAVTIATAHRGNELTTGGQVIVAGMHGGSSQALPDQLSLLRKGVVLCFDCFGRVEWLAGPEYYPSDEESAVRIADLVRQGFAGQIVISQGVSRRIHLSRWVTCVVYCGLDTNTYAHFAQGESCSHREHAYNYGDWLCIG